MAENIHPPARETEPMSLFDAVEKNHMDAAKPLAARMRPTKLVDFVGQQHFLGEGKLLSRLLQARRLLEGAALQLLVP